jgi:tetratricopeptide (TPR) repeat protein
MEEAGLPRQAAELYRRALRLKEGLRAPHERAKVLYALASLRQREGEPRAALAALRLLGRSVPSDARGETLRREAARLAAWIRYFQGKPEAAESSLARLLSPTDGVDAREEAALRCDLGWFALSRGRGEARVHLTRVMSL